MIATADRLRALPPGELLVKVAREGWTIAPDWRAIARSNAALRNYGARMGEYHGAAPDARQRECLTGAP